MTLDPKTAFYITIGFAVLGALSTGAVPWPSSVPAAITMPVKEWSLFLVSWGAILSPLIPGLSSARPGPLVSQPAAVASVQEAKREIVDLGDTSHKLPLALLALGLAATMLLFSPSAQAAPRHAPVPVPRPAASGILPDPLNIFGNGKSTLNTAITALQNASVDDLSAAKAVADAIGDGNGSACYAGILSVVQAQQKALADQPNLPKVHLFTTFEQTRAFVMSMRVGSPVKNACAPLAEEVKMDVLSVVTQIAAGTFSFGTVAPFLGL